MKIKLEGLLGTANQIIIYAVPIISIPLLYRSLGEDYLSDIIFTQALMALLIIFSEFGFNNFFIKNYSRRKEEERTHKFNKILSTKLSITLIALPFVAIFLYLTNRFNITTFLLLSTIISCLDCGPLAIVNRFYEKYSILIAASKISYLLLLVLFVKSSDDIFSYIVITVLHQLPFYLVLYVPRFKLDIRGSLNVCRESVRYFYPKINQNLYLNIPILANEFLNTSLANTVVGIPQKIFNALTMVLNPFLSLIFRDMSVRYSNRRINIIIFLTFIFYCAIAAVLYGFAPLMLRLLTDTNVDHEMLEIFKILIMFIPFMTINMILGNSVLLANNRVNIITLSSFCALLICALLVLAGAIFQSDIEFMIALILAPKLVELIIRAIYCYRMNLIL
jgi:PST family polysaccharide transporter